ncbi:MAG: hypothetical protein ACYTFY_09615 [Planctomycetota bacterium]|jgi:hypothetical protein
MKKTIKLLNLLLLLCFTITVAGCFSGMVGRSAGGDLIWWCDKCQCQVGHPSSHLCGKTKYDYSTKKDTPLEGITSNEIEELLRKDRDQRSGRKSSYTDATGNKKWKFWQKKAGSAPAADNGSYNSGKREVNQPYWKNSPKDTNYNTVPQEQQDKKKWQFWKKNAAAPEDKYLPPPAEPVQQKSKWKFWQR